MINEITCLKNLEKNLEWFTLEFDFTQETDPKKHLEEITDTIAKQSIYEPYKIFENMTKKGFYHVYCRKK